MIVISLLETYEKRDFNYIIVKLKKLRNEVFLRSSIYLIEILAF